MGRLVQPHLEISFVEACVVNCLFDRFRPMRCATKGEEGM